jgi:hypothetical protein
MTPKNRNIYNSLFLLIIGLTGSLFSQHISKQPYLVLPGQNSMIVRLELDKKADCVLEYGVSDKKMIYHKKGMLRGVKENHYLYEFRLENLTGRQTYYYRVAAGEEKSAIRNFTTYGGNKKNIHFVAMGDSRSNPDIFKAIMTNVKNDRPDFIISMGDLVGRGGAFDEWNTYFFNIAEDVIADIPLVSALGDHEGNDDNGELFRHYFLTDEPLKKQWFSFDYGDAHFAVLDYRRADSAEMINWFIDDVSKSKARWKFVYMHRPCYNFSGHQSRWGFNKWPELFRKFKIDIVFAGHSHIYERFFPIRPFDEADAWAVTYITTGGAGAGLYKETGKYKPLAAAGSINHFVDIRISGDTLILRTIKNDASLFDSLTITKRGNIQSKKYLAMAIDQNEVDLLSGFISAISLSLDYVPLGSSRTPGVDLLLESTVDEDIPFSIELSNESKEFYKMKAVSGILPENEKITVHLNPLGGIKDYVCVHKWGELNPPLQVKMIYKYTGKEDTLISIPAKYWY